MQQRHNSHLKNCSKFALPDHLLTSLSNQL